MNGDLDYPRWVNEHEYEDVWKGEVVRVDIRKLRTVRIPDELLEYSAVTVGRFIKRHLLMRLVER